MKYLTTAALALVLAVSAAGANAQPTNSTNGGDHAGHGGASGGQSHGGPQPAAPRAGQPAGVQSGRSIAPPAGQSNANQGTHGNYHGPTAGVRGPGTYVPPSGFMVGPQGHAGVFGAGAHPGVFNGPGRGGVPGADHAQRARDSGRTWYNPSATPHRFSAQRSFHADWGQRPSGWYARSWSYGDFLPLGWFDQPYYLDWSDFGLPPPPIGCEWVREGNDALLVDVWTGQVLSVDYGVFL